MTPVETRRTSDHAIAGVQAMRDAVAAFEGRQVEPYEGAASDFYVQTFESWLADMRAPVLEPLSMPRIRMLSR